jgi:hypothetical protein
MCFLMLSCPLLLTLFLVLLMIHLVMHGKVSGMLTLQSMGTELLLHHV